MCTTVYALNLYGKTTSLNTQLHVNTSSEKNQINKSFDSMYRLRPFRDSTSYSFQIIHTSYRDTAENNTFAIFTKKSMHLKSDFVIISSLILASE